MSPRMNIGNIFCRAARSTVPNCVRLAGVAILLLVLVSFVQGNSDSPVVLLEFTSNGCGACQQIKPLIDELKAKGYPVQAISYDLPENKEIFRRYHITSMPSFVMLCHGQESGRFISQGEDSAQVQTHLLALFQKATAQRQSQTQKRQSETAVHPIEAPVQKAPLREVAATSLQTAVSAPTVTLPQTGPDTTVPAEYAQMSQHGQNASTVRIRVFHNNAVDRGTGTIIHVNQGQGNLEALVLTCGHIFRPSQGKGRIELDVFHPETGQQTTVRGECIHYDDETDLGFIGMPLPFAVAPVQLVPPEYQVKTGDRVVSIGCSNGENPTQLEHQVLSVDKKFFKSDEARPQKKSFYYIQVSTAPVGGRSGGGLFVRDDAGLHLLGVCNAGDAQTNEGFFVPAKIIYEEILSCQNLSFVYNDLLRRSQGAVISPVSATSIPNAPQHESIRQALYEGQQLPPTATSTPTQDIPLATPAVPVHPLASPNSLGTSNTAEPPTQEDHNALLFNAGLDELKKRQKEGAEIICIVKWPEQQTAGQAREMEVIRLPKKQ